jgi:hypothetical protein
MGGFQDERANARRLPLQNHLTGNIAGPTGDARILARLGAEMYQRK